MESWDNGERTEPVPPGHGEPGDNYAMPGHDPRCRCGRPLDIYRKKDGSGYFLACPQHGVYIDPNERRDENERLPRT